MLAALLIAAILVNTVLMVLAVQKTIWLKSFYKPPRRGVLTGESSLISTHHERRKGTKEG